MNIPFSIQRNAVTGNMVFGSDVVVMARQFVESASDARLICDVSVWMLHERKLLALPGIDGDVSRVFQVPSGETSKSIAQFGRLCSAILASGIRRNTTLYVAGGGVCGDLGGYVAASLHRGLRLIHIPTTILAMVDSSIGGKTGINDVSGKNLIGAFYQPAAILADVTFLKTLPEAEWANGLGEILKYGLIADMTLLEKPWEGSLTKDANLLEVLSRCAAIKIGTVERDENEQGERAYLNFGHTFAHALETATAYGFYKHGEAVFYGLLAALQFSKELGYPVHPDVLNPFRKWYAFDFSPVREKIAELLFLMQADKKNREADAYRLILLREYEKPVIEKITDKKAVSRAWEWLLEQHA